VGPWRRSDVTWLQDVGSKRDGIEDELKLSAGPNIA
jgi:hypothetical protein